MSAKQRAEAATHGSHQPERVVYYALRDARGILPPRHAAAVDLWSRPGVDPGKSAFEWGLLSTLEGLARYAGAHARQYGSPIAADPVMGQAWRQSLAGLQQFLTGERGRLDGGVLDSAILALYQAAGFEGDEP